MSFTQELKFSDLTKLLEALSATKAVNKRDKYLEDYFEKLKKFQAQFKSKNPSKNSTLLPVLRLILSQEEKERAYGLAEKSLRQLYIKALNLSKTSNDAIKLTQCSEFDLPNKVYEVMQTRESESTASVYEVDQTLHMFSENQKISFQETELRRLIQCTDARDQKWLCRMILKKRMNTGLTKILRIYHPQAYDLFLKYNHLSLVVETIESGKAESAMVEETEVFKPIRSMLCQKFTSDSDKNFLKQKQLFHETKMDGERFQIHMKDGNFRYYSRNGHEYSDGFNELLTPLIKFKAVVRSLILDGEMLVYDKHHQRYHTKGETTIDVKHMKNQGSALRPCFCAFDILFFNDQSFLNRPYHERYQLLAELFQDQEGVMVKTKPVRIRDVDHMVELLNIAIDSDEEGIVLKDAESHYKPGDRSGGWYKVKPDYFDGEVVKEFDCVIIGGYYQNPYQKDYIRRYMVGAVEKQSDESFNVYAIGEVVHGVSVKERMSNFETLKAHLVDHRGESEISFGKGKIFFGDNKPDAWLPPDKSIVLECRVSELARSREQFTEYTFRFPRISSVRRDKLWDESCTLQEFNEMCPSAGDGKVKKVTLRNVNKADIISPSRKRQAAVSRESIIKKFCHNSEDLEEIVQIDNVLEGKEFCVLTTDKNLPSIKTMQATVRKHGGTITHFPRDGKTFAILAGVITRNVLGYVNKKIHNVIHASWLVRNFGEDGSTVHQEMPLIRPVADLYFGTPEFLESMKEIFDEFGDSFTHEITEDELGALVGSMERCDASENQLAELEDELGAVGLANTNFFRKMSAGFYATRDDNFKFNFARTIFKFRAGKVSNLRDGKICFVDKNDGIEKIKEAVMGKSGGQVILVDYRWILDSSDAGRALERKSYEICC